MGSLWRTLGIIDKYHRLFEASLHMLRRRGWIHLDEGRIQTTARLPPGDARAVARLLAEKKSDLLRGFPELKPHVQLLDQSGASCSRLFGGEISATEVLFPGSSLALLEPVYAESPGASHFNRVLLVALRAGVELWCNRNRGQKIRILELGAGTGATSAMLVEGLEELADVVEYTYTDVSLAFLDHGRKRLSARYPFVKFELLDIDKDFLRQGLARHSFHVVIASNVLHVCLKLKETLRRIRGVLVPGGCLMLNEATQFSSFLTMTFGFLDGWWRYQDPEVRLPHAPLLSPPMWRSLLDGEGFPCCMSFGLPGQEDEASLPQAVLIAERDARADRAEEGPIAEDSVCGGEESSASGPARPGDRARPTAAKRARVAALETLLRRRTAEVLHMDPSELAADQAFAEAGVDSIIAIELVNNVNSELEIELKAIDLFDYGSISRLAEHIAISWPEPGSSDGEKEDGRGAPPPPVDSRAPFGGSPVAAEAPAKAGRRAALEASEPRPELGVFNGSAPAAAEAPAKAGRETAPRTREPHARVDLGALVGSAARAAEVPAASREAAPPARARRVDPSALFGGPACAAQANAATSQVAAFRSPSRPDGDRATEADSPAAAGAVAIIGMSCRFPGADDPGAFWDNLARGADSIRALPAERRTLQQWPSDDRDLRSAGIGYCGGFLSGIDEFDPSFFNISPLEAQLMDPQQRLLLQEAWKALENAGYDPEDLAGGRCGVFVGAKAGGYLDPLRAAREEAGTFLLSGNAVGMLAARISYFLDLKGPCLVVDTECSSSLVALHLARESVLRGECELAVAAGAYLLGGPQSHLVLDAAQILSPSGRCRTFDDSADGAAVGEGVGVVVLKPLDRAVADGDHIYAVILGSAINHDGRSNGITAPASTSQTALQAEVYRQAKANPQTITYVEAHGTGTKLGDPIEIQSLTRSFRMWTEARQFCAIGSVKTNIGHTMTAAGIAGVIKVSLAFEHRQIPPSLHFTRENRFLSLTETPFYVQTSLADWATPPGVRRRAAINSFGASGTNAHLLLEEAPPSTAAPSKPREPWSIIPLSAKTREALQRRCEGLLRWLEHEEGRHDLHDIGYTLSVGRSHFNVREALVAQDVADLAAQLRGLLRQQRVSGDRPLRGVGPEPRSAGEARAEELTRALRAEAPGAGMPRREGLLELAELYAQGVDIDWRQMYGRGGGRRLALPSYPFASERYWHELRPRPEERRAIADAAPVQSSLGQGAPGGGGLSFTRVIDADDPALADHVIHARKVLPGVILIEMARAAGAASLGATSPLTIQNFVWSRPVLVGSSPRPLKITTSGDRRAVNVEIRSEGDEEPVLHASGTLAPSRLQEPVEEPLQLDQIRRRCTRRMGGEELYRLLEEKSFHYGPRFRVIAELFHGDREVLASIDASEVSWPSLPAGAIHPSILEGALQAAACLTSSESAGSSGAYLPWTLREMRALAVPHGRCYAYARALEPSSDMRTRTFDVLIADPEGRPFVILRGFCVMAARLDERETDDQGAGRAPGPGSAAALSYHRSAWVATALPSGDAQVLAGGAVVLDSHARRWSTLRRVLGSSAAVPGGGLVLVLPGERFRALGDMRFEIDPTSFDDYGALLTELERLGIRPRHFLHLWSWDAPPLDYQSGAQLAHQPGELQRQLSTGLYSLFYLSKALIARRPVEVTSLLTLYRCSEEEVPPHLAAIAGFLRSLRHEHPLMRGKLVEVARRSDGVSPDLLEILGNEHLQGAEQDTEVRYDARGERWGRRQQRIEPPDESAARAQTATGALRRGGVYLVVGGTGGLGYALSRHLARNYHAKLVLVGRSAPGEASRRAVEALRALGGQALYVQADVASYPAVQRAVEQARARFHGISGVIHAAGVIRDNYIVRKSAEEIDAVLASKVLGAIHLDAATAQDQLDLFVMFSSIASFFGSPGQSDYAAANAFMDSYAAMRAHWVRQGTRRGQTVSINWPLWEAGGMGLSPEVREHIIQTTGLAALPTEQGLEAFEAVLRTGLSQAAVLFGDDAQAAPANPPTTAGDGAVGAPVRSATVELRAHVEEYLKEIIARTTKLPTHRIDARDTMERFGLDSILTLKVIAEIERDFGEQPKTLLFEHSTIASLASYLMDVQGARARELAARRAGERPGGGPRAEAELRKGRSEADGDRSPSVAQLLDQLRGHRRDLRRHVEGLPEAVIDELLQHLLLDSIAVQ
ncbi:uncharacterized protein SOCE836_052180 [Sorangium cellulosum]|uniref:Polyketide synthase n=2 Tax=Polyangiaceae TaxID=49 RepID=A0A4P2QSN9_SORCE|nr:uncharacterized protein SOCE836_052180 [Sorangium cellulosum]WCQ92440.1 FabG-like 3-oxoacyl-(acyl-carrier-protein) reductase [Sorangium sp. Soce836]